MEDWRGIFIRHLAFALAARKDIALSQWAPPGPRPDGATYAASEIEERWLTRLMQRGGIAHQFRSRGIGGKVVPLQLLRHLWRAYRREPADIYHVNWLQNVLPLPHNGRPVLVTVLGTDMQMLKVPAMAYLIRHALKGRAAAICPNASWMVPELERQFGDIAIIREIAFGMEPCWFTLSRQVRGPVSRWLCVTRITKGKLGNLFSWCAPLFASGNRELHLFGPMQEEIEIPSWVHYHGPTTPDALNENWFTNAAGLITLSQHPEGRPQVMLEAMAAGLPIIASCLPAHLDLIRHGKTGWLCDSSENLSTALDTLEDVGSNTRIGEAARAWVAREIGTWEDAGGRYAEIYRQLLAGSIT